MLRVAQIAFLVVLVFASAWWLVADLDWATVRDTLASANPGYLLGVVGLLVVNHVARSLRIRALVRAPVAAWDLLRISAVSFLAIQVLPLRLGEFVRPQLLVGQGV
ncbi:MAG: lysylphosphatidylglycerol synthase domain-containing protein, partial [Myxococcota bacterium]